MAERRDYVAIDWVLGEIAVTMNQACEALEAYTADPADATRLRFCLRYIHQIQGTLRMLEFDGTALLVREMEVLAKAMVDGVLSDQSRGVEVLTASLLQLPSYLDRARAARRDLPRVLLPMINELRAVRGDSLVTDSVLFAPPMAAAKPLLEAQPELAQEEFSTLIQNLRQMFQVAFVGIIRNRQLSQNLECLDNVCQRLYVLSQGKAREPLWKITLGVVDGLLNRTIEPNMAVKSLLKEIDNEIKHLLEEGRSYLDQPPAPQLMKNLLYYVAGSDSGSPLITGIQQDYQLKEALAESSLEDRGVADAGALRSVVEALIDELGIVKQALDLFARGSANAEATLVQCMPVLKRVGDTLAVLGLTDVLALVRTQSESLQRVMASVDPRDAAPTLLDVASHLIEIEARLLQEPLQVAPSGEQRATPHVDEALRAVAHESRLGLDKVKEFIVEFVASQWQHSMLASVPDLLAGIRGNMLMVKFVDSARIIWACESYISEICAHKTIPEWRILDTLADALSSVDYYLERYLEDSAGSHEMILHAAMSTVAELGFPPSEFDAQRLPLAEPGISAAAGAAGADGACGKPTLQLVGTDEALGTMPVHSTAAQRVAEPAPELEPELELDIDLDIAAPMAVADSGGVNIAMDNAGERDAAEGASRSPDPLLDVPLEIAVEEVLDPDIAEIFEEEAAEVLDMIHSELPKWRGDLADSAALAELRRAWHTLKGSGRMVGACIAGELAWSVENLLNKIVDGALPANENHGVLIERVTELIPGLVSAFAQSKEINKAYVDQVVDIVQQFYGIVAEPAALLAAIDPVWIDPARVIAARATPRDSAVSTNADVGAVQAVMVPVDENSDELERAASEAAEDAELWDIFRAEAATHLDVLNVFIEGAQQSLEPQPVSDALQRALHTLKGSANMAGQMTLAGVVTPLEKLVKSLQLSGALADAEVLSVLLRSGQWLDECLGAGAAGEKPDLQHAEYRQLLEDIAALAQIHGTIKSEQSREERTLLEAVGQFMLNAADHLQAMTQGLMERADGLSARAVVLQHCTPVADQAVELGLSALADLAQACVQAAQRIAPDELDAAAVELVLSATVQLEEMLDCLAADQATPAAEPALLEALSALVRVSAQTEVVTDGAQAQDAGATVVTCASAAVTPTAEIAPPEAEEFDGEEIDADVLEIFIEEARDLLESLDDTIHGWQRDRTDWSYLDLLKRQLHTLKGSARLVGLVGLGDWSHDYETFVSAVEQRGDAFDDAFFAEVQRYQDGVIGKVEAVIGRAGAAPQALVISQASPEVTDASALVHVDSGGEPLIDIVKVQKKDRVPASPAADSVRQEPQAVKVSSQLLEGLVNLAGETSINRGRVDEQINEVAYSLAEMDATIERMQEQLRRLDRETEAQLMFRQEQVESLGLEEFDPLEMDRYSVLQQLSRSLMESAYDVREVKRAIFNKTRDIEALLAQQSRVNTDLQEGLMRTRMVPFTRMVPRLRRIVSQVGRELGKDVALVVNNVGGEMDRTILERMVPPFEHMLRNACDHGIETREERLALGKPDSASIAISFEREAGDIVITLSDDGRGINLATVKAKAVERGMVSADARLSDHDILQFILQPGFSTAQAVTQISGRGVGMDVVSSEIKQLGGSVSIESILGEGTSFIIRLPFTVSVNRALMVQICTESYALPLNTIEGIVRVSPFELESYYQPDAPQFEYAGQSYRLCYMGAMIGRRRLPDLSSETSPLPVILVRSGDQSVAVQVDSLLGSREIVVKTLGPQFNAVQGLSGATVLGDGGVVVILDLHAMIRSDLAQALSRDDEGGQVAGEAARENRNRLVMVVDDSVTVRKVTSRFLERNGMDVLLAKDGVDAMRLLQEHTPDVMLLDIEMPRMDGFEVANRVKHNHRLEHLPIIMITSRTGQKHRERAEAIGVDRYLGKPYQEMELLRNIDELIGVTHQGML